MHRTVRFSLLALTGAAAVLWAADDEKVTFRSDVSLVRVDAQVLDSNNRAITGLRATDFILKEDGKPQQIRNFASEDMPVDVLFLLDVSASMRPHVQRIADAAHEAFQALGEQDRIGIMVFDRSTRIRMPFRNSRSEAEQEFQHLLRQETFRGGTDITRGLLDAATYVRRNGRREARRAIVILTDDQTERDRDEIGVETALSNGDAVLSALIAPDAMAGRYPQGGNYPGGGYPGGGRRGGGYGGLGGIILGQPRYPGGGGNRYPGGGGGYPGGGGGYPGGNTPHTQSAGTSQIALSSGGDTMSVDDAQALENTLTRLRQRYALHFYQRDSAQTGQKHRIVVALADPTRRQHPDAEVRYRRSYLAAGGAGTDAPASAEPIQVTRAGSDDAASSTSAVDPDRPVMRRRPAVDDSGSGSQPIILTPNGSQSGDSVRPRGVWRRTDDANSSPKVATVPSPDAAQPSTPATAAAQPKPGQDAETKQPEKKSGWRKAEPDDK